MFSIWIEWIVLPSVPRQNGHSHLWSLSSTDWGACGYCAGEALACGAFRVCQVWEALPGSSTLREARPGLLWDALSSALRKSVFRLQSGHWRRWYVIGILFIEKLTNIYILSWQYLLLWTRRGAYITLPALCAIRKWHRNRNSTSTTRSPCARNVMNASLMNWDAACVPHTRWPWRRTSSEWTVAISGCISITQIYAKTCQKIKVPFAV